MRKNRNQEHRACSAASGCEPGLNLPNGGEGSPNPSVKQRSPSLASTRHACDSFDLKDDCRGKGHCSGAGNAQASGVLPLPAGPLARLATRLPKGRHTGLPCFIGVTAVAKGIAAGQVMLKVVASFLCPQVHWRVLRLAFPKGDIRVCPVSSE